MARRASSTALKQLFEVGRAAVRRVDGRGHHGFGRHVEGYGGRRVRLRRLGPGEGRLHRRGEPDALGPRCDARFAQCGAGAVRGLLLDDFRRQRRHPDANGDTIAQALEQVPVLVANLEAAAQAENARRAAARAWAEAKAQEEANRNALEKAGHAVSEFFGGGNDTPPPVNVGGNPSVSAPRHSRLRASPWRARAVRVAFRRRTRTSCGPSRRRRRVPATSSRASRTHWTSRCGRSCRHARGRTWMRPAAWRRCRSG